MEPYYALACAVLVVHGLFIVWVIFGAALTAGHRVLGWLHIGSWLWGVWIEAGPWPCPLTYAENWFELRAGRQAYQGGFLLHYLDRIVYPNIPPAWLTEAAVGVAVVNAAIYARRIWRARKTARK
jgi:Protein of Unknown function (DUF2784)